jgi:hypothetical protein
MAVYLEGLAGEQEVRHTTRALIEFVIRAVETTPEPMKSELDAAGGELWRVYQATFGAG